MELNAEHQEVRDRFSDRIRARFAAALLKRLQMPETDCMDDVDDE